MATEMMRCSACKGRGKRVVGGMESDCRSCDGDGKVAVATELCSLADIFPGIEKSFEVEPIHSVNSSEPKEVAEPVKKKEKKAEVELPEPLFPGYSDELIRAILEEGQMSGSAWKEKHKNNNEVFITLNGTIISEILDVRARASIREMYAMSRPAAPRKVDLSAAQDAAASSDAEYLKLVEQDKAKQKVKK